MIDFKVVPFITEEERAKLVEARALIVQMREVLVECVDHQYTVNARRTLNAADAWLKANP